MYALEKKSPDDDDKKMNVVSPHVHLRMVDRTPQQHSATVVVQQTQYSRQSKACGCLLFVLLLLALFWYCEVDMVIGAAIGLGLFILLLGLLMSSA